MHVQRPLTEIISVTTAGDCTALKQTGATYCEPATSDRPQQRSWSRTMLREAAICSSLANLCLLRLWMELLTYTPANVFFVRHLPGRTQYAAALICELLVAAGLWSAGWLLRRSFMPGFVKRTAWLLLALIIANQVRLVLSVVIPASYRYLRQPVMRQAGVGPVFAIIGIGLCGAGFACQHWRLMRYGPALILILAPLAPLFCAQAAWKVAVPPLDIAGPVPARPVPVSSSAPHVVWLVFDEWDFRLTFPERPPGLALPEVDRWSRASDIFTGALPAGPETLVSVPSLLTGQHVRDVQAQSPFDALVTTDNGHGSLRAMRSVFGVAHNLRMNTAVVGWYLPYCRLWGSEVTSCEWWDSDSEEVSKPLPLPQLIADHICSLSETGVLSPFGMSVAARRAVRTHESVVHAAARAIADPEFQFVFAHLPTTHAPYYFDRRTGRTDAGNSYLDHYVDHLALLDRVLARFRGALETASLWDRTTLIVTSDHSWRSSRAFDGRHDDRVPLLIRFPGETKQIRPSGRLRAGRLFDLVTGLLEGRIVTRGDLQLWAESARVR